VPGRQRERCRQTRTLPTAESVPAYQQATKRGLDKLRNGEVKISGVGLSISWLVVVLVRDYLVVTRRKR